MQERNVDSAWLSRECVLGVLEGTVGVQSLRHYYDGLTVTVTVLASQRVNYETFSNEPFRPPRTTLGGIIRGRLTQT